MENTNQPCLADLDFLGGTVLDQNEVDSVSNSASSSASGSTDNESGFDEELQIEIEQAKCDQILKEIRNANRLLLPGLFPEPTKSRSEHATDSESLTQHYSASPHFSNNQVSNKLTELHCSSSSNEDFFRSNKHYQQLTKPQADPNYSVDQLAIRSDANKDSGMSFGSEQSVWHPSTYAEQFDHEDKQSDLQTLSGSFGSTREATTSAIKDVILSRNGGKLMNFFLEGASLQEKAGHVSSRVNDESDQMPRDPFKCSPFDPKNRPSFSNSVDQRIDQMFHTPQPNQPLFSSPQAIYRPQFGPSGEHTTNYPNRIIQKYVNINRNTAHQPTAGNAPPLRSNDQQTPAGSLFANNNYLYGQPIVQSTTRPAILPGPPGRTAGAAHEDENAEIKNLILNKLSKSHKKQNAIDKTQERKLIKIQSKSLDFDHFNRFYINHPNSTTTPHDQDGFNAVYNFKSSEKVFKNKENRQVQFDRLVNTKFFEKNENGAHDPLHEVYDLNEEISQNQSGLFEEGELFDKKELIQILGDVFPDPTNTSSLISDLSSFNHQPAEVDSGEPACAGGLSSPFPAPASDPRLSKRVQEANQVASSPLSAAYGGKGEKKMVFSSKGKGSPSSGKVSNSPNAQSSAGLNRPKRACQIKSAPFHLDYNQMLDLQVNQAQLKLWCDLKKHNSVILDSYVRFPKPGIAEINSHIIGRVHSLIRDEKLLIVCPDGSNKVIDFKSISNKQFEKKEFNEWLSESKKHSARMPSRDEYEQKKIDIQRADQQDKTDERVRQVQQRLSGASNEPTISNSKESAAPKEPPKSRSKPKQPKPAVEDNKLFKEFDSIVRPTKPSKSVVRQPVASKNLSLNDRPNDDEFKDMRMSTDALRFQGSKAISSSNSLPAKKPAGNSRPIKQPAKQIKKSLINAKHFSSMSSDSDDSFDLKPTTPAAKPDPTSSSEESSDENVRSSAKHKPAIQNDKSPKSAPIDKRSKGSVISVTSSSSDSEDSDSETKSLDKPEHETVRPGKQIRIKRDRQQSISSDSDESADLAPQRKNRKKSEVDADHQRPLKRHSPTKSSSDRIEESSGRLKPGHKKVKILTDSTDDDSDDDVRELQKQIKALQEECRRKKESKLESKSESKNKKFKKRTSSSSPKELSAASDKPAAAKSSDLFLPKPPKLIKFKNSPSASSKNSGSGTERPKTKSSLPTAAESKRTASTSFYKECYPETDSSECSQVPIGGHDKSRPVKGDRLPCEKANRVVAKSPLKAKKAEPARIKPERLVPETGAKSTSFGSSKEPKSTARAENKVVHSKQESTDSLQSGQRMNREHLKILFRQARLRLNSGNLESCTKKLNKLVSEWYGERLKAKCVDEIDIKWLVQSNIAYDQVEMRKTSSYRIFMSKKYNKNS